MSLELHENTLLGKILAENGRTLLLPRDKAMALAEKYQGQAVPSASGRYMVRLPDWATTLAECDCGCQEPAATAGQIRPETYNQYPDHEVQMARQELYRTAKLALMTHDLLSRVGEQQGLEGWVQSKLTRAADYIETVFAYLDYETRFPSGMMEDNTVVAPSQQQTPGSTGSQQQPVPGQSQTMGADGKNKTPGMVKMAKIDTNGKIQGTPIMVPQAGIKSKQQAGFHVIGESASAGASSAGGVASGMGFGNGFLNGGPGSVQRRNKKRRKTTEGVYKVTYGKPGEEGKFTGLKEAATKQEVVDYCTKKGYIFFDAQLTEAKMKKAGKQPRETTTEAWDMLDPAKPYGLSNPRILTVGDDPQGIYDFAVTGKNVLSIYPFNANQWSNHQLNARNKGYMLKYVGADPEKAAIAHSGDTPRTGYNMAGQKLESATKQRLDAKCWAGKHKEGTKIKGGVRVNNCVPNEGVEESANTLFDVKVVDPKTGNEKTMEISALTATEAKSKVAGKTVEVDGEKKHYKVISVKSAWNEAANPAQQAAIAIAKKKKKGMKEGETGPKFTGYYKGTDKGKPGKKMVGDA